MFCLTDSRFCCAARMLPHGARCKPSAVGPYGLPRCTKRLLGMPRSPSKPRRAHPNESSAATWSRIARDEPVTHGDVRAAWTHSSRGYSPGAARPPMPCGARRRGGEGEPQTANGLWSSLLQLSALGNVAA